MKLLDNTEKLPVLKVLIASAEVIKDKCIKHETGYCYLRSIRFDCRLRIHYLLNAWSYEIFTWFTWGSGFKSLLLLLNFV